MKRSLAFLLLVASCGTPGGDIQPQPGDFAFIEIQLQG